MLVALSKRERQDPAIARLSLPNRAPWAMTAAIGLEKPSVHSYEAACCVRARQAGSALARRPW
jgi:hypothetical protein